MHKLSVPSMLLVCFSLFWSPARAGNETGYPFIRNFPATQYKAHTQNFAITRDRNGIIYFGNFAGILQFDGEFWRLIPTLNTTKVSSLAVDSSGTIFVGARGEIGYLAPGMDGDLDFISIPEESGTKVPPFTEVNFTYATGKGICFITKNEIFTWSKGKLDMWKPEQEIISGFSVGDDLYLQLKEKGLVIYRDGTIVPVAKGEIFSGAIEIKSILPLSDGQLLVATGTQGLYVIDRNGVKDFPASVDAWFEKNMITSAIGLSDGTYAIGTSRNGIVIMNPDGTLKQLIDKKAQLQDNYVQSLFADKNNILWVALNNGISLIELPAPLSYFDDKMGLNGGVNCLQRAGGKFYAATSQGLFQFDDKVSEFVDFPDIITACWWMIPDGNNLLAATSQGIYSVVNGKGRLIAEGFSMVLVRSVQDPSVVYSGQLDGLYELKRNGIGWSSRRIDGPSGEINDLTIDASGDLWGSTISKEIFRYTPATGKVDVFNAAYGLPDVAGNAINLVDGKVTVATRKGVFVFDDAKQKFVMIRLTQQDTTRADEWFTTICSDRDGNLWVTYGDETDVSLLQKKGNGYTPFQTPFLPIAEFVIWSIYPEQNGLVWFGGPDGLIKYDPSVKKEISASFRSMIRRITLNNDSLIYNGNGFPANVTPQENIFRYNDNTIRFEFAAPFFAAEGDNQYQYKLEGFEETWSDWTTQTHKEYTNLPKGNFIFQVRAKNIFGNISSDAFYRFMILSPWYTRWWAYALYIIAAGILVWFIMVLRNRQLLKEKRSLEQKIEERTAEVVQQKEEIQKQSQELTNKNDELEKISTVVKAINSEIHFQNLLQSLLEKTRMIKSVDKSTALVFDKNINAFRFKATFGWDLKALENVTLTLAQAEKRYLKDSEEIFEDIFLKTDFRSIEPVHALDELGSPKAMLVLVIKVENKVEAFLILENMIRENAFEPRDLSFIRNSKEHIISAFIKTRILEDLQHTLQNLKETQDQLIQSEKLASLGQLTAGIAHEIQNPLNFVNNFSTLSADLADELKEFLEEIKDGLKEEKYTDIAEVVEMIKGNVTKIHEHGKRAESIVKGMLQHSRGKTGEFEKVDINNLVSEYMNLAYHGMRAKDKSFNTSLKTSLDPAVG
ncbi:MAG: triple tyrosine motif-containing protein, partial [bacterium]